MGLLTISGARTFKKAPEEPPRDVWQLPAADHDGGADIRAARRAPAAVRQRPSVL